MGSELPKKTKMASSVASCERFFPTNASNHVNFRQHFRSKEVQLDRHQTVTKWSESKRFTTHRLKTESEIEGNKNEGHNGKFEGNDGSCTCSVIRVEKKEVSNADETIMIETVETKEEDTVNQEGKYRPGPKRVCRVVSLKDKEFQRRIKQTPKIFDEMSKNNELSVNSTEAKNSEFMREAKNCHNEEKKIQTESTLATPNNFPSTPYLSNREPFLNNESVQNVTRTSENRVTVEVKIRIQPNRSTPSLETTERNNRETGDERHETAEESSANGSVFDLIEAKRRLCDQNYSPTSKEIDLQAANTYEINRNKTATVPKETQTSLKVSKDYSDSKQLSLNVDVQSRQDSAATNRDDFQGELSHDDDNETDDSLYARDPLVVLSQLTDKTSLHGFNVDEISSAGDETVRNSTDSRPAIEDVEHTMSEFQLDVNRKPAELRTRRIRAVTIAGINPEIGEIMKNYQTPESFLIAESKRNDVTKSEENLGRVGNLRENHTDAATEPRDRMSLGRSMSLHQSNAYGLQPRLWKLPSFRSYSNNTAIFTSDRNLLQQLSDEVKDILMADARRRRISSNEIQKMAEKTEDDKQQHSDANYRVRTEDKLSLENQLNNYSTFNDATEFQGVQSERSNPEEIADLDETTPRKSHNNGATDVDFPTSESIIIQDSGSNLSTSEFASKPRPSDFAFQATEDKITEPKPRANHIDDEKGDRNFLDALSDDMLAKALERMVIIAASEEYLKLVDLREREELESALRRQRKDGRQFQPRRSLHEKCLSTNEKPPQNPLTESGDKSYGFAQKVDDDDDEEEEPTISFSESLNN